MPKIEEAKLKALLAEEISTAESFALTELTPDRERAINYYNGKVPDVPAVEGRSSYISRDVSNVVGWTLPDIMRVFTASDRIVDCLPETEGDEDAADQAADYLNFCFWRDNPGYQIMWDATWDSLVNKDGVVKQFWDIKEEIKYHTYSGLDQNDIAVLLAEEGVELVEQSKPYSTTVPVEVQVPVPPPVEAQPLVDLNDATLGGQEMPPQEMPGEPMAPVEPETVTEVQFQPVELYDIKIKRTTKKGRLCYQTVAPENFLTNADAIDLITNWRFQAEKCVDVTRSDLIKMGFAKDRVDAIPSYNAADTSTEDLARRNLVNSQYDNPESSMERVDLYECYVKLDINDDGVAEVVKVMYAGNSGGAEILDWEEWDDETPYDKIPCNPVPHRLSSDSLADEVMDLQKFKTVVGRQFFDNIYQTNTPQPVVKEKNVLNMDAVVNRQIGVPIIVKDMDAIRWDTTPFIGDKALMAMEYLDGVIEMRTGVSRSSTALDPETLQNQTATAANLAKSASHSQVELIARNQAELGWKRVFQKSLKLIVKNQDRPRTIRLRDKWVKMDPRQWNTGMDIVINVGLGTGSRDRDMAMLSQILNSQIMITDRFAVAGFSDKAIDMLPKINKTLIKIAEAAGIKSPETYYPETSPEDIEAMKAKINEMAGQGTPEEKAAQEKLAADMRVKQAEMQMKQQQMQGEAQLKREQLAAEMQMKRDQFTAEVQLRREQMAAELALKREMAGTEAFLKVSGLNDGVGGGAVRLGGEMG